MSFKDSITELNKQKQCDLEKISIFIEKTAQENKNHEKESTNELQNIFPFPPTHNTGFQLNFLHMVMNQHVFYNF